MDQDELSRKAVAVDEAVRRLLMSMNPALVSHSLAYVLTMYAITNIVKPDEAAARATVAIRDVIDKIGLSKALKVEVQNGN